MKYRSDIDGLRALAVLPVLFYHGGMSLFSGGYVGVDIFFVISGYLITSVIVEEIRQGKFTISGFYLRRIRRIFPALFFIVSAVFIIGFFIQMPYDFRNFGKSLAATVFFGSNIYFNKQMGYFADAAESKPLLHTWSLSVEEQYYIFFPLMLILIAKYLHSKYLRYIAGLALLSFAVSVYAVRYMPDDAFYLLIPRAWELFLGALLALGAVPVSKNKNIMSFAAFAGLMMIVYSVGFYTADTPFPGWAALLPCGGAFLLIYAGMTENPVSRLLSLRPLVFIGLISYSLYLWHWPLIAFFNDYRPVLDISDADAQKVMLCILALSFVLSVLTYKYIETPFRRMRPANMKRFFAYTFAVMTAYCLLGATAYWTKGFPGRLPEPVALLDHGHDDFEKMGSCKDKRMDSFSYESVRRIGAETAEPEFLVFGDSHAGALYPGFDLYGKESGTGGLLITNNGLVPLRGFGHKWKDCHEETVSKTMNLIKEHDSIEKVILVSRWVVYVNGERMRKGKLVTIYDENKNPVPRGETKQYVLDRMVETVREIQQAGREVFVVAGVPEVDVSVPSVLSRSAFLSDTFGIKGVVDFRTSESEHKDYFGGVLDVMAELEKTTGAKVLYPDRVLKNGDKYDITAEGAALYMDGNHLSERGAVYVMRSLAPEVFN